MKKKLLAATAAILALSPVVTNFTQVSTVQAATTVPKKFRGNWRAVAGKALFADYRLTGSTFKGRLVFKGVKDSEIAYTWAYDDYFEKVKPTAYKLTTNAHTTDPKKAVIKKLGKNKIMITTNQPGAVKMYITAGKARVYGNTYEKAMKVKFNNSKMVPFFVNEN